MNLYVLIEGGGEVISWEQRDDFQKKIPSQQDCEPAMKSSL